MTDSYKPYWYDLLCRVDERHNIDDNNEDIKGFDVAVVKNKKYVKRRLLDDYPADTLVNHIIVQAVTPEGKILFGIFPSYLEYARYHYSLKPERRCFFETNLGNRSQKPHFDIDINIEENPDIDGSDVIDDLIDCILDVLSKSDVEIILQEHVLIFSSHGTKKKSYHVIIDSFMHLNNLEAKAFYNEVIMHVNPDYAQYIDKAVYSSKQQFRIVGNQKPGSGRIKVLMEEWSYHGEIIKYQYSQEPRDDYHKLLLQLDASLISNTAGCLPMPNFMKVDDNGRIIRTSKSGETRTEQSDSYFEEDISKDIAVKALMLLAETAGLTIRDPRFPYSLLNISGGIISLRRLKPSRCRICNRVHENENPYLFIIGDDYTVFFNCRRNDKNWLVGTLGKQGSNNAGSLNASGELSSSQNSSSQTPSPKNTSSQNSPSQNPSSQNPSSQNSPSKIEDDTNSIINIQLLPSNVVSMVGDMAKQKTAAVKPIIPPNSANQELNEKSLGNIWDAF